MHCFKKSVLIAFSSLILLGNVNAASCGYEEKAKLNNEIANVKANYEIKERVLDKSEYDAPDGIDGEEFVAKTDYVQINILNLTENFYVVVSSDDGSDDLVFNYSDTSKGNITFNQNNIDNIVTYTVKVYASSNTECEGSLLKTLTVKAPRYNDYSTYEICEQIPDYYLCQRYVTYESVGFDTFFKKVRKEAAKQAENEKEKENDKWYKKAINFVSEHKTPFIVGGITLVVVASGATVIIIKKRRRSII